MDLGEDSRPKIGAVKFNPGIAIVTQQFNPFKEATLLQTISVRENLVDDVVNEAKNCAGYKPYSPAKFFYSLNALRFATVTVIEAILHWRNGLVHPEPFMVAGENYLLKIIHDVEILRVMPCLDLFGLEFGLRNPFVFPCEPRTSVKKALAEKRKKQEADKAKKKALEEKMKQNGLKKKEDEPSKDAHTHVLRPGQILLPRARDDVEVLVPDRELAVLMKDLSVVTQEHWVSICECEAVLKEEEDRYSTKASGPAVAGTGWGLERWTKAPWKAPRVPHKGGGKRESGGSHKNNNAATATPNTSEGRYDDGDDDDHGDEARPDDHHDHRNQTTVVLKKTKHGHRQQQGRQNGHGQEEPPPQQPEKFTELSKADQMRLMANTLKHEELAMEKAGRTTGIPTCASIIEQMDDSRKPSMRGYHGSPHARASGTAQSTGGHSSSMSTPQKSLPSTSIGGSGTGAAAAATAASTPGGEQKLAQLPGLPSSSVKKKKKSRKGKRGGVSEGPRGFKTPISSSWDFDPSVEILDDVPPDKSD
jgi:hypothetical protein